MIMMGKSIRQKKVKIHFHCNRLYESVLFDALHYPIKNIKSSYLENTPIGGATSVTWIDDKKVKCFKTKNSNVNFVSQIF